MKNDCKSELPAPFYGVQIHHQCSAGATGHTGNHYCGCSYEWNTELIILHAPDQATAKPRTSI